MRQPVPALAPVAFREGKEGQRMNLTRFPNRTETFHPANMRHRSVACSSTGSLVNGRTHMRQREPRCSKWICQWPSGRPRASSSRPWSFFCAFCRSGSACPIAGPGLRNRKPHCRNIRWHCRTPKSIPYPRSFHAASVLPSQISAQASHPPKQAKGASRSAVSTAPTVHPRAVRLAFFFEPANPILDRFSVAPPNCAAFRRRHIMTRQ